MTGPAEENIQGMERILSLYLGPIGPITLNTQIKNLGLDHILRIRFTKLKWLKLILLTYLIRP